MEKVTTFTPYEFIVGEKIHISGGPRRGDWLVTGVGSKGVTLQCPISKKEFIWKNFCYLSSKESQVWPMTTGQ
ncbi:hypothetical protein UWK_00079 [Desulfocapsa sulfexigens DSM 10523]|uniref:Uncharacterized protein n=1 Tax=Desulfocapsa sulfexigens (strain DSM 10523 / SB164P1) TaxID=1167006 RepID=M1P4P0_DESSD|nr:hypothetical protein [Desulfocapsa sulfexigens]AGF76667.1 hypothetical protein UWK_00079 [Desulfocapsa sulfexigens DSM 10523]